MELQSETPMKIRYQNGTVIEGSTLSRTEETMRIAVKGRDDVMQFTNIYGTWVSEECEPVIMEMGIAWRPADHFSDDNFICPQELATRLMHLLFTGDTEDSLEEQSLLKMSRVAISSLIA